MSKNNLIIFLGADHAGFSLKEKIKKFLLKKNYQVKDLGAFSYNPSDDYPDFGYKVAQKVRKAQNNRGILVCGSSIGVCIVANKLPGVYAAQVNNLREAKLSRLHNQTNVLCLSGWFLNPHKALKIVETWLQTPFSGEERHQRRIAKIRQIEKKYLKK